MVNLTHNFENLVNYGNISNNKISEHCSGNCFFAFIFTYNICYCFNWLLKILTLTKILEYLLFIMLYFLNLDDKEEKKTNESNNDNKEKE